MSAVRTAALAALADQQVKMEEARREELRRIAEAAARQAVESPLGDWFPGVDWAWVVTLKDGTVLVREDGDPDGLLFGLHPAKDVGAYQRVAGSSVMTAFGMPASYYRVATFCSAADVGEHIDRTEPKPAPMPLEEGLID